MWASASSSSATLTISARGMELEAVAELAHGDLPEHPGAAEDEDAR